MSKILKYYIDNDVYTEAKNRIKHVINTFDKIFVSFSGGKDSLVVLRLCEEVYEELGITKKLNVIFRDEELIPDDVIDFVTAEYNSGKHNFYYYAVPLKSHKFILGQSLEYIQWDTNREWVRPKPEFAITLEEGDNRVFDQHSMDEFVTAGHKGKIAILTGIRADESLVRLRAAINKKNENYINATDVHNVKLVKPIFDWTQDDVFLYFYKRQIKYCVIYDNQMLNGEALRVSTPLHAQSAKNFHKLKTVYPNFYQQIVNIFPEMLLQDRYWKQFDRQGIMYQYEHSWDGIIQYINDNLEGKDAALAKKRVFEAKQMRENRMARGEGLHNLGGYPILYVFKSILGGNYNKTLQANGTASKTMYDYEGIPEYVD